MVSTWIFAKLLPRDKVLQAEDHRMEMIMKGSQAFWVPVSDHGQSILSFSKWEQAYRVYSDIYLREHPTRSTELIQYNHIIYTASLSYVWENVYSYDKDFRLHMSRHPERNWGIILQQAWAMRLKDKLGGRYDHGGQSYSKPSAAGQGSPKGEGQVSGIDINDICRRYNKGRCSFGSSCKYEHRCLYCFQIWSPNYSLSENWARQI